MGVETSARLKGHVLPEEILNFIRQKIDKNATMDIHTDTYKEISKYEFVKRHYGDSKNCIVHSGFIYFTSKAGNKRMLSYYYSNINSYPNLKYYSRVGLEDMVKSESTDLSLGHNDESVDIMMDILKEFGGWIDKNDCDDDPYEPIVKNPDGNIKPVYHVSMQDIYDKFGGVVIIDKFK